MSKVRIVDPLKESIRVTSVGPIKFDKNGVSVEEYEREEIIGVVEASAQLVIQGEKKIVKVVEKAVEEKPKNKMYSREELDVEIAKNAERLIQSISDTLGLSIELIESKLASGILETVPQKLVEETIQKTPPAPSQLVVAKEKLSKMSIEDLRATLLEAEIDSKLWESLKGASGKLKMIELILNRIKEESNK